MNERINEFKNIMKEFSPIPIDKLEEIGFFTAPASTKYHGAYEGGLFDHSLEVTKQLLNLTEKLGLKWSNERSPYLVGMFHDFCKTNSYMFDGEKFVYNPDEFICGHADKSIILLSQYTTLTEEEIACIRWHMGAYERDTSMWDYYDKAIRKYPNVLYTHTADMIASKIVGV